jgi:5-methylcytosine-specific restriction enzyme A
MTGVFNMPPRIPKACRKQGCSHVTTDLSGYCTHHKPTENGWARHQKGRSRHERGYGSSWDKLRKQVLQRDKYICQCDECKGLGLVKEATHVDHIVAKAHGGTDDLSNLRAINKHCHDKKTARERLR